MPIGDAQQCTCFVLMGMMGFVCGVYFQQESSIRQLFGLIRRDPYVFHYRRRLYPIVSTFSTDHEARLWKRSQCFTDKIRDFMLFSVVDFIGNLFFERSEKLSQPDLLDLVKYGLPSAENLRVHKDYIVSQDLSTSAPKWMCEHLRSNYRKLTTDEDGDELHLRYHDVFVLSCGAQRACKAFNRKIWKKLETHLSHMAEKFGSVYVYTGPMYLPSHRSGENWNLEYQIVDWVPLPQPSHFFKVIIVDPNEPGLTPYMEGYIIDNKNTTSSSSDKLHDYLCDIAEIERHTGLRFFQGVQSTVHFDRRKYGTDLHSSRIQDLDEEQTSSELNLNINR